MADTKTNVTVALNASAAQKQIDALTERVKRLEEQMKRFNLRSRETSKNFNVASSAMKAFGLGALSIFKRLDNAVLGVTRRIFSLRGAASAYVISSIARRGFNFAEGLIEPASQMELLRTRIQSLPGGSPEVAQQSQKWLLDFVSKNPTYELDTLTKSFVQLRAAGLDPTAGSLQVLADSIAAFGGTSADLDKAVLAIQQMLGKGTIGKEELRQQFGERVPGAVKILARELGVSVAEMNKQIEQALLSSDVGVPALLRGLEKDFSGASQRMSGTWVGLMGILKNEWFKLKLDMLDDNAFEFLKKQIMDFTSALKDNWQGIIDVFKAIGSTLYASFKRLFGVGENSNPYVTAMNLMVKVTKQFMITFVQMASYIDIAAKRIIGAVLGIKEVFETIPGKEVDIKFLPFTEGIKAGKDSLFGKIAGIFSHSPSGAQYGVGVPEETMKELITLRDDMKRLRNSNEELEKYLLTTTDNATLQSRARSRLEMQRKALEVTSERYRTLRAPYFDSIGDIYRRGGGDYLTSGSPLESLLPGLEGINTDLGLTVRGRTPVESSIFGGDMTTQSKGSPMERFSTAWSNTLAKLNSEFKSTFKNIETTVEYAVTTMTNSMSEGFKSFFSDAVRGEMESFMDYFNDFLLRIADSLNEMLAQQMSSAVMKYVGQGIGGLFGSGAAIGGAAPAGVPFANPSAPVPAPVYGPFQKGMSKASVNIINNTGTAIKAESASMSYDPQRQVVSVILDAASRDVGGLRTNLKAMLR